MTGTREAHDHGIMDVVAAIFGKAEWVTTLREYGTSLSHGRRRLATIGAAVLVVAVAYHVIFGADGLTAYEHNREQKQLLTTQMQTLQQENDALRGHVERLQNDPDAIEHQAREQLHYARPGEVIYQLPSK